MADNTTTNLDRGPKGLDQRAVTVESARYAVSGVSLHQQGEPPGTRPVHAIGLYLQGEFQPSAPDAGDPLFTADIFDLQTKTPVITRLSPTRMDAKPVDRDIHGIGVRIGAGAELTGISIGAPEGDPTDLAAIGFEPFPFREAEAFADFLSLLMRGGWRIAQALVGAIGNTIVGIAGLRGIWELFAAYLASNRPLDEITYSGIHTFFADTTLAGKPVRIPFRYRLVPVAGMMTSPPTDSTILGRYRAVAAQVDAGRPYMIDLVAQIPRQPERYGYWAEVPERMRRRMLDPTRVWTDDDARRIVLGRITLDKVADANALTTDADGKPGWTADKFDRMVFDPTRLTDGLYPSDDPLLRARGGIYAESLIRRRP